MEISELHKRVALESALPVEAVDPPPIQAILLDAIKTDGLARHIQNILSNSLLCSQLASESYLHPNGFEKYGLTPLSDQRCRIRLHVWKPENKHRYDDANYHSHVRDFASIVLTGRLCDCLYTESLDPDQYSSAKLNKYKVHDRPIGGQYVFKELKSSDLHLQQHRLLEKGDTYYLPYSQVHRTIIPSNEITRTIFAQGPERNSWSIVYSAAGYRSNKDSGAGSFTVDEYKTAIKQALDEIHHSPAF